MKIKKGDNVQVIAGKDRGKTGTVLRILPEDNRLSVEGINMYRKRVRAKRAGQKGESVSVPRPLTASNVMLVCKNCKRPVRVGYRGEGRAKERFCKKCQATI